MIYESLCKPWFERLIAHAAELMARGAPVVLAGDYNVVPTPQDIYPTRSLDNNALIQPQSREVLARLLAQGWSDAMRRLHPDGKQGIVMGHSGGLNLALQNAPSRDLRSLRLPQVTQAIDSRASASPPSPKASNII
jgi:hypothetical protein